MNPELVRLYAENRAKGWKAREAFRSARYAVTVRPNWYIDRLPTSDYDEEVDVPGVGVLKFTTINDYDHCAFDQGCGQEFTWITDYPPEKFRLGTNLGGDSYSLHHTDGNRLFTVTFNKKDGTRLEDRRRYESKAGYSRQDADLRARQSIQQECDYWYRVQLGDVSFVGFVVRLYTVEDDREVELGEESCYGYEWDGFTGYPLAEVNDWARSLISTHWPDGPEPETLARPIPSTEVAWKAWECAMIAADGDRSIADPIFVATYKEYNHAG